MLIKQADFPLTSKLEGASQQSHGIIRINNKNRGEKNPYVGKNHASGKHMLRMGPRCAHSGLRVAGYIVHIKIQNKTQETRY